MIARAAMGHTSALGEMTFRELYDAYFDFAWRSVRRLGVEESDVPDAVQEVFVVVHRKLPEFEGRSKVTTWLFGICLRVSSERRRRSRTRRSVLVDGERGDGALAAARAEELDAEEAMSRQQQRALVDRVLDELPEDQRAVFVLFELEGMAGEEIAATLEIPEGTVRSRLRLAREAFRSTLSRFEARERFRAQGGAP